MFKVLLAVDGSDASLRATDQLIGLAARFNDPVEVHITTAHLTIPVAGRAANVVGQDAIDRYYREEMATALSPSIAKLRAAGITPIEHAVLGEPAASIVESATANGCEMIIMGTRGMGAIRSLVLGSIATKVVHLAQVPVLLVH